MRKNTKSLPKAIIDTSTFFSALYNVNGNEAMLFELADKGKCSIHIIQYVLDELEAVFKRKGIDFDIVLDILDRYRNVVIEELENITDSEIELSRELIDDPGDRPIFIFAYRMLGNDEGAYFISGDKVFFKQKVLEYLNSRVLRTRKFIEMLRSD